MFMQIRSYYLKSGTVQEVSELAEENFAPIIRTIPGFVDYLIVGCEDNRVLSISIFKDRAGLEESKEQALKWNKQNAFSQLPGPPEIIEGEILFEGSLDKKITKAA
jgi:hypothetical protein